ncbi:MAG: hypothetical protein IT315_03990 [Anaerolineales bacterium]|nr:hypothetical protein [Anaerolineales bacterium]
MNAEEIRYHLRGRWKAVEEIERQELRASTIQQNWKKLNEIMIRAKLLGLSRNDDDGEMEVFLRWAKLKEKYEASRRTTDIP